MSTQTEITRLQTARNKLRTWLVGLGLAASTDKLDALADKAAAIKNNGEIKVWMGAAGARAKWTDAAFVPI